MMLPDPIASTLHEVARGEGPVLFLTGAGISAESGIPTFRGKEGYWTVGSEHYQPMELATRRSFGRLPRDVWHWYLYRRTVCRAAEPNAGHLALVELERAFGDRFGLVTQNVDGLHLRAGNSPSRTYAIHGDIEFMRCADRCTDATLPIPPEIGAKDRDTPLRDDEFERLTCPDCGGLTRPHVLWFDEHYDEALFFFDSALTAAQRARLLVVVGTSGTTNLPLHVANTVAAHGRPIIDVNPDDNVFGEQAERSRGGGVLRGPAAQWVPVIVDALVRT